MENLTERIKLVLEQVKKRKSINDPIAPRSDMALGALIELEWCIKTLEEAIKDCKTCDVAVVSSSIQITEEMCHIICGAVSLTDRESCSDIQIEFNMDSEKVLLRALAEAYPDVVAMYHFDLS